MKEKKLLQVISLIILLTILAFVFAPYSRLNDKVAQADLVMKGMGSVYAFKVYKQAEIEWPVLKLNLDFQRKVSESKKVFSEYKKNHPALIFFLKDTVTDQQIQSILDELYKMDGVVKTKFVSKEEALKVYRERNKQDSKLLNLVNRDVLPMSIEIYMDDWFKANDVKTKTKSKEFVDNIIGPNLDI